LGLVFSLSRPPRAGKALTVSSNYSRAWRMKVWPYVDLLEAQPACGVVDEETFEGGCFCRR